LPITGFIKNTSPLSFQSFKMFSGSSSFPGFDYQLSTDLKGLKIKPNNSGQFVLGFSGGTSFSLDEFKQALPLAGNLFFSTSLGSIDVPVNFPLRSSPVSFFDFEMDSSGNFGQTGSFWSFNLERQSCSGTRFEFILDDLRWLDPFYSFSNSFFIQTGYNNNSFLSALVPYNSTRTSYIGTGFISGAGCSGNDTFKTRFEILYSHPSGFYSNRFSYLIRGIEDQFLFSGILEHGIS